MQQQQHRFVRLATSIVLALTLTATLASASLASTRSISCANGGTYNPAATPPCPLGPYGF